MRSIDGEVVQERSIKKKDSLFQGSLLERIIFFSPNAVSAQG